LLLQQNKHFDCKIVTFKKLDKFLLCYDFLIDNRIIVECKAVHQSAELDQAQVINYLKITEKHVALLINSNVRRLKDGLKRLVSKYDENE